MKSKIIALALFAMTAATVALVPAYQSMGGMTPVKLPPVDTLTNEQSSIEVVFVLDTTGSIFTAGLLGEQYIALDPGGAMDNLGDGSRIQLTQSALVMEQIIGQFLYSMAAKDDE